jgi:phosphonate transport system substrate-binding protein
MRWLKVGRAIAVVTVLHMVMSVATVVQADSLILGVHPYLSTTELHARFEPLCTYLSERTGDDVELQVAPTFNALIDALLQGQVDVAFMGSSNYVLLSRRSTQLVLLGRLHNREGQLHGAIVVPQDSPLQRVDDLRGRQIAFVSPDSTMGYRLTTCVLQQAGIHADDLAGWQFLHNHENVAYAVLGGFFDAGSVKQEILRDPRFGHLRVLVPLPAVADHLFVACKGARLSGERLHTFQQILLSLNETPRGRELLQGIRDDVIAIQPVEDAVYDRLRQYETCVDTFEAGR